MPHGNYKTPSVCPLAGGAVHPKTTRQLFRLSFSISGSPALVFQLSLSSFWVSTSRFAALVLQPSFLQPSFLH